MLEPLNAHLDELVVEPRETLEIELKEWLDLTDNNHRAGLAKEIIALANHGGGYIVVGFQQNADGSFARITNDQALQSWEQDQIQGIVSKYIEPAIQCRVVHHKVKGTEDRHPIIIVPGGHRIPVKAKAGSPDNAKLVANRIYIRRAGPNSEEPRTAEEWDRLLDRCVKNRQAELLEAMRAIMSGVLPTSAGATQEVTRADELRDFEEDAIARWQERIRPLPADASPRLIYGHYDIGVAITGQIDIKSLPDLRKTICAAVRNHSGWPPFLTIDRPPYSPKPVNGAVEMWLGADKDGSFDQPAHHDFWRVAPNGLLFTRRGFQEDGGVYPEITPGTTFDITTATWRVGEAIMQASYIAHALDAMGGDLICHCKWTGLRGRRLISRGNPNRILSAITKNSAQDTYEATQTVALDALPQALPEIVFAILQPLYELFDFFRLPKRLVDEELNNLLRQTYQV